MEGTGNGLVRMFFSTEDCLFDFIKDIFEGKGLVKSRLNLAMSFHNSDQYDVCLDILEAITDIDPKNVQVLILKADTLVHQEKYKEAEIIIKRVLVTNKDEYQAWELLSDIYFEQKEWIKLLKVSEKALELYPQSRYRDWITLHQAKAFIEMGNLSEAEEKLGSLEGSKKKMVIKKLKELREEIKSFKVMQNSQS